MKNKLIEISDNKNKILIDIVYLISKSERWYSLKEIAGIIELSDRSSQRYVNLLYDLIVDYNKKKGNHFSLLTKKNYGVKLLINKHTNIEFLINYILQEDENIKLLKSLSFHDYETMNDYEEHNFLAKYYVNQACCKCDDILELFSLKIDKKKFEFIGLETNIRIFIYHFCWTLYNCEVWPSCFQFINYNEIESDILYITEALSIPITNPIKLKKIMYFLTIFLIRYNSKETVVLSENIRRYIPVYVNESENPILTDIITHIFEKHSIFNQDEAYFFILYLLCGSTIYKSPYIKINIFDYHNKINSEAFQATVLFLDVFQKKIGSISSEYFDVSFDFIFRSHLKSSVYSDLQIEFGEDYFSDGTLENSLNYSNKMRDLIEFMKKQKNLALFEDVTYLSQQYIMLILSLNLQKKYNNPIHIKLNTDYPTVYEDFIKKYISDYFKYDYNLVFINNNYFQKPDLILNTLPELEFSEQEVINITYPICDRELEKIKISLEKLNM